MFDILLETLSRESRILVVGDVMLDSYVSGRAGRISPEAPVPVLRVGGRRDVPGGAGNVALNLAGLGATVTLTGGTGGDEAEKILAGLLDEAGVVFRPCRLHRPTTRKTRVVSGRQQMIRIDEEETSLLSKADANRVYTELDSLDWSAFDALLISDYDKGFCTPDVCRHILDRAGAAGIRVFVDPKGSAWDKYRGAWLVTPNLKELSVIAGEPVPNKDVPVTRAARTVRERFGLEHLLVTRSEQGMSLVSADGETHIPTEAREVFDVSGAGDTVVAALARLSAAGMALPDAVEAANRAAGVVIAHAGTYPVSAAELLEASREDRAPWTEKVIPYDDAADLSQSLKDTGKRVVFTNGVFDILHAGHVSYLDRAAALGDSLILGLNSDASTRRLKGPERPVNPEDSRAMVLAALAAVDYVIVFEEDTPLDLIRAVAPDVLVKGGDYRIEDIVGREYAGRTTTLPFLEGHSTTSIIGKTRGDG